jgi:hypothetical protein
MVYRRDTMPHAARLTLAAFLAFPLACDDKKDDAPAKADGPATVEKVEGKISVGGKEAKVTSCDAVAKKQGTALELTLDSGLTVISDAMEGMQWRKGEGAAEKLACDRMASQLSGGKAGAGAWSTGNLGLTCKHADGDIEADLTIDCGVVDRPSNQKPKT